MDCWGILGLEGPTSDMKVIKRAYAKKLRVTRPDDDPEGFMALRDALEQAKFSAQYVDFEDIEFDNIPLEETASVDIETIDRPEERTDTHQNSEVGQALRKNLVNKLEADALSTDAQTSDNDQDNTTDEVSETNTETDTEHLINDVRALLSDTFGRAETARWKIIFEDERLDAIDTAIDFEDHLRSFFLDEFGYFNGDASAANRNRKRPLLTTTVGTFIFNQMGWRDTNGRPLHIQDQIEWLRIDLDVINRDRPKAQVKADIEYVDQYFSENEESDGFPGWAIGAILFGLYIVGKFLSNAYGNGMY